MAAPAEELCGARAVTNVQTELRSFQAAFRLCECVCVCVGKRLDMATVWHSNFRSSRVSAEERVLQLDRGSAEGLCPTKLPSALLENAPAGLRPGSLRGQVAYGLFSLISFGVPFLESGTPGQNPTPTNHHFLCHSWRLA